MKALKVIGLILLSSSAVLALYLYACTYTPYGRLPLKTVIFIKVGELISSEDAPPPETITQAMREEVDAGMLQLMKAPEYFPQIKNHLVTWDSLQVQVRIYAPKSAPNTPRPFMLYMHGGGWVVGNPDHVDNICRFFAEQGEMLVLSVDYRLAPEHPYPAGLDDTEAVFNWAYAHRDSLGIDRTRMVVAGESAGGNLAAALCHIVRDREGVDFAAQLLYYPIMQLYNLETESYLNFAKGYGLTREILLLTRQAYAPDSSLYRNPQVSPLLGEHHDLPPTLIINAAFDILRDDGAMYEEALQKARVPVERWLYPGMLHGFVTNDRFFGEESKEVLDYSWEYLQKQW